jgi:hypothetical protein
VLVAYAVIAAYVEILRASWSDALRMTGAGARRANRNDWGVGIAGMVGDGSDLGVGGAGTACRAPTAENLKGDG